MLSSKPTFSLSTFTFIERLLSSSSLSAIRACFYSVALSQPLKSQPLRPLVLHCSPLTPKTSYFQGSPGRTGPLVTQFVPFTPRGQGFQEGGSGARARCTKGSGEEHAPCCPCRPKGSGEEHAPCCPCRPWSLQPPGLVAQSGSLSQVSSSLQVAFSQEPVFLSSS